ncbi:MAG: 30S ribosomal protein S13 [Mycoplasmataceae bacterium]|jgi:small subunit ribosomal protein S13|nr:30S ribosomal protein S13 [Mycoplasmataceae bacterium]
MARLLGVDIPNNKKVPYSISHIFGIGIPLGKKICKLANVDAEKRVKDLNEKEFAALRDISLKYTTEGDLRREISQNIKNLMEMGCYRGSRHKKGLPVRGQRSKTNARTRKGPRKTIANKKVETK